LLQLLKDQTKVLELSDCDKLSDMALEKIGKCKSLTKIDLNSNALPRVGITSEGVANLARNCKYLQSLLLRRCVNVDDKCVEVIAQNCPMLRSLNVANCPLVTDHALISLGKHCKFLKSINVTGTKVCVHDFKYICYN
jgi:F-box/leucine-rich repeat protein 2/20